MVCAASTYGGAVAETESLALPVGAMLRVFQFIDCKSIGFGKDGTGSELGGSMRLTLGDDAQGVDRAVADGETVARRTDETAGGAQGGMGMESEFHKCECYVGVIILQCRLRTSITSSAKLRLVSISAMGNRYFNSQMQFCFRMKVGTAWDGRGMEAGEARRDYGKEGDVLKIETFARSREAGDRQREANLTLGGRVDEGGERIR